MSLEGLFRLHLGGLFWTSVVCLVIWLVLGFIAESARAEGDRAAVVALATVRRLLLIAVLVTGGVWLVDGLITNATPRAVIDRSEVNRQQEEREKRLRREAQESKEKEERR